MTLVSPDQCPGHNWPNKHRIAKLHPGEAPRCTWCGIAGAPKTDPRRVFGARWVA